ncbi:interferon-stimulated 20 kDa exonuclease-like 2 [Erpetoichthys calabaricus]|uniref:Interferon stimulated exonuclease 20 like 2 n=1 Tax=Erpetoichthys calabaricus TaxID=27687 RepID=A0A8C4RGT1_ERPCA|nr:interferon-stimulated 20 kDa exonuclease-like 2 [Erpetoichthys calabaricus]
MSDIMLNVDYTDSSSCRNQEKDKGSNKKHLAFLKRRKYLEKMGFLRQKQLQDPHYPPKVLPGSSKSWPNGLVQKCHQQESRPASKSCSSIIENHVTSTIQSKPAFLLPTPVAFSSTPVHQSLSTASFHLPFCSPSGLPLPNTELLKQFQSGLTSAGKPLKYLAMDCEMVGTGPKGRHSELARCSIVGYHGDIMYDKYIMPANPVTDYRTRWSGITKHHLRNAVPFKEAQKEILKILSGKVVIGHAVHNDFKALNYFHPPALTRDTSRIPLLNVKAGISGVETASLKRLTKLLLNKDIQVGQSGHSSVEDAKATMDLYKIVELEWERILASSPAVQCTVSV